MEKKGIEHRLLKNVLQKTTDLLPEFRIGLVAADAAVLSIPSLGCILSLCTAALPPAAAFSADRAVIRGQRPDRTPDDLS